MQKHVLWLLFFCGSAFGFLGEVEAQSLPPEKLTIEQAGREALDKNLGLIAERFNVTLVEAQLITARLRPNPVLSLGADHLDLLGTGYNSINTAGPPEYSARVDFPIERGGKRQFRIEVASNAKTVAELNVLNATRALMVDVQQACVEVLAAKETVALAQQNLKALNTIVEVNSTRVRAGDLAPVELVRTRIAAMDFQNSVIQAGTRLRTARNRLQTLLGRKVLSEDFDVTDQFRQDSLTVGIEAVLSQAMQLRPDLRALKQDQARSAADLKLQLAQGKVDYTVGVEYRRQQGLAGRGSSLGFFFSIPLPVFNRNQGEIQRVQSEQLQIEAKIKALEHDIHQEVENAYLQFQTARSLLANYDSGMVEQAREVLTTTEYSYRKGQAGLLEYLDAQRAFNDTMQGYNAARADYARSLYLLEAATGKAVMP